MEATSTTSFGVLRRDLSVPIWPAQLSWFAAGAVLAFLVPFVFSSVLELHHDLYLAVSFAFVAGCLFAYVRANAIDVGDVVRRNWKWGLVAGIVLGIPIVRNVFTESSTHRGPRRAFEEARRFARSRYPRRGSRQR